jgi:hypothetical protein
MFRSPLINVYSHDVMRLVRLYEGIGFRETFRTQHGGEPVHVEVTLDKFTIGIASVDAAIADHGLSPSLGEHPVEIVLWTDDTDGAYSRLTANGAPSLSPPHDFLGSLAPPGWRTQTVIQFNSFNAAKRVQAFNTVCTLMDDAICRRRNHARCSLASLNLDYRVRIPVWAERDE